VCGRRYKYKSVAHTTSQPKKVIKSSNYVHLLTRTASLFSQFIRLTAAKQQPTPTNIFTNNRKVGSRDAQRKYHRPILISAGKSRFQLHFAINTRPINAGGRKHLCTRFAASANYLLRFCYAFLVRSA
jgi:hypothetical protein